MPKVTPEMCFASGPADARIRRHRALARTFRPFRSFGYRGGDPPASAELEQRSCGRAARLRETADCWASDDCSDTPCVLDGASGPEQPVSIPSVTRRRFFSDVSETPQAAQPVSIPSQGGRVPIARCRSCDVGYEAERLPRLDRLQHGQRVRSSKHAIFCDASAIDTHVHLREPGLTKGGYASGTKLPRPGA